MRIGIINFHFAHNFGAVLESLALKEYLEKNGHSVLTIDYRPEYLEAQYSVWPNPFSYARWAAKDFKDSPTIYRVYRMLRRFVQAFICLKDVRARKERNEKFNAYITKYMDLTCRYGTVSDLKKNPPECDLFISGSDQIWNPKVTAGIDEAYFLSFGTKNVKRVAYAVSPCQLDAKKYKDVLKSLFKEYDAISLRENQLVEEIQEISGRNVSKCLDPTLLLNKEDYRKYSSSLDNLPEKYILVYGFVDYEHPSFLNDVVTYVSKLTKETVIDVSIDNKTGVVSSQKIEALSPGEFLYCIEHADFIVTNSFHGTVFSIIYNKSFVCVGKSGTESRSKELLEELNLENNYITDYNEPKIQHIITEKNNYEEVGLLLEKMRKESIAYLNSYCI